LVGFELADGFVATSVLLAPPADKLTRDAAIAIMHAASSRRRGQRDRLAEMMFWFLASV
jgi:hypothetical protein